VIDLLFAFAIVAQTSVPATPAGPAAPAAPVQQAPAKQVQPAPVGYLTANDLALRCADPSPTATTYCFAFVTGVHDAAQAYELWLNQREFCTPRGTAQADLRRAFLTYLAAYPANRSGEAASVVIVALKETYPC
jgi:hypothetical protein